MNILRVIYDWPPPWIGLAPAPFSLTKAQTKLGRHVITVFCGRWPKAGPLEAIPGVKVVPFLRTPVQGLMLMTTAPVMSLYFLLWRLLHKPDLYHIHGHFGLWIYAYKFLFGWLDKTPVVAHFHICVAARWEEAKKEGKPVRLLTRLVDWPLELLSDKLGIKVADACIFVSSSCRDDFVTYHKADLAKCFVVDSGIDSDYFYPISGQEKEHRKMKLGYSSEDILILNDGLWVERKNIHLLIECLKFLPQNYKLLLVGKASTPSYFERLRKLVAENKLEGRVTFKDSVPYKDIAYYEQAADVYCLPSSYEGFSKVILQSLACGVPTLASGFELPAISGLVKVESFDASSLASQIQDLTKNKPFVDHSMVIKEYSWDKKALQVEDIYNKILS